MSNDLNVSFIDKGTIFFNFILFDCISFYFLLFLVVFFRGKGGSRSVIKMVHLIWSFFFLIWMWYRVDIEALDDSSKCGEILNEKSK